MVLQARILGWALAVLLPFSCVPAQAQSDYPAKPVRIYVATAPGTGGDEVARLAGTAMGKLLKQSFVAVNHPGAGGMLAMDMGAHSPADGYTLTLGTSSTLITAPAISPSDAHYSVKKDFVPVAGLAESAYVVLVPNTDQAPKTLVELLTRLKQDKNATFGSLGVGTFGHLSSELLLKRAKVTALHVPYKTSGLTDLAAGRLTFASETIAGAMPLISSGMLRALAVTSSQRLANLPSVPTVAECTTPEFDLSNFKVTAWWGLFAPTGTPAETVRRLSDAAMQAMGDPDVQRQFKSMELDAMALPSDRFNQLVNQEYPMWTDFVHQLGLAGNN